MQCYSSSPRLRVSPSTSGRGGPVSPTPASCR
jgi:hypothetical protein